MSFGGKGNLKDGMKEPLVPEKFSEGEKKGVGGVVFPADHVKVPMSAFVNPKHPDKVDTDLDPEGACVVIAAAANAEAHARAIKEIIWGGICLGFLIVAALAFLGGSYSLSQIVDFESSPNRYKGWCAVPYNYSNTRKIDIEDLLSKENLSPSFFHERFTIDAGEDDFKTEVEVPDFKGGRHGRFLHDFRRNLTAIIDVTGGRCFIMPLDTRHVLRPSSLVDVLTQMNRGHYQVNTKIVRETMRVVWPPMGNRASLGVYIGGACGNRDTYWLEKTSLADSDMHPTLKRRSATFDYRVKREDSSDDDGDVEGPIALPSTEQLHRPEDTIVFSEFAGRNVLEFDIVGLDGPSPAA